MKMIKTKVAYEIVLFSFLAITYTQVVAYKCYSLQDFCVADLLTSVQVNNDYSCIDPKNAKPDHFFFGGLHLEGNTSNSLGSKVNLVTVTQIPGLNTLGISIARIDYAPQGVVPPHIHPRASEILTVLDGTLFVGFVTSNLENRLISKVLQKGDVFIFPKGLVHFQQNVGPKNAVSISGFQCQDPGVITVANNIFASNPWIHDDVLTEAFEVDKNVIDYLRSQF